MPQIQKLLACFLVTAATCQAFTGGLKTQTNSQQKGTMEPWLVGLSAVVGFLFLVFFILIVKRIFFKKDKNENVRKREEIYGFDNKAMEMEMEMEMGKAAETKLTSL